MGGSYGFIAATLSALAWVPASFRHQAKVHPLFAGSNVSNAFQQLIEVIRYAGSGRILQAFVVHGSLPIVNLLLVMGIMEFIGFMRLIVA